VNEIDFIYDQIYKGALRENAREKSAHNAATIGVSEYKKGRFKKVPELIGRMINQAKKGCF